MKQTDFQLLHFNYRLMIQELLRRDVSCRLVPSTDILECSYQSHKEYLLETANRLIPSHYVTMLNDKIYAKYLLKDNYLPTAPFVVISTQDIDQVIELIESHLEYPICIKPHNFNHGYFVHPSIQNRNDLLFVWNESLAAKKFPVLLAEKHICGDDIRVFLMEGELPVILKRTPPKILGNGIDSLRTLIEIENEKRLNPRTSCLCDIYLKDPDGMRCLQRQGLTLDSIVEKDREVSLLFISNVTYGGSCQILDSIHEDYLNLARQVFSLFPGLSYLAVDFLITDYNKPFSPGNAVISELCTYPGYSMFLMPPTGHRVDIVARIVDRLFPETKK